MKTAILLASSAVASVALIGIARAEPAADQAVSIGTFAYAIDGYLSSTPAVLSGLDVTYDHALTDSVGVRARAGAILVGVDEITGVAPHGEAGPAARLALGPRLVLDASLLGGFHLGGLEHKQAWEDGSGPTLMAEAALQLALTRRVHASLGGGYRVAWTASRRIDSVAGDDADQLATGPVARFNLGWSF